jgi:hypothetical protein
MRRPNAVGLPSLRTQKGELRFARSDRRVMQGWEQLPRSSRVCQQTGGSILLCGLKMYQFPLDGENTYCSCIEKSEFLENGRTAAPITRIFHDEERVTGATKNCVVFGPYVQGQFVPGLIQMRVKD